MRQTRTKPKSSSRGFEQAWLMVSVVVVLAGVIGFSAYYFQNKQQSLSVDVSRSSASEQAAQYDLNNDGKVDTIDFGIMLSASAGQAENAKADLNADGKTDAQDLEIFRAGFSEVAN